MTQFIDTLVGIFQSSGFCTVWPARRLAVRRDDLRGLLFAVPRHRQGVRTSDPAAHGLWHDPCQPLPGSGIIHMQYFVGDGLEHPMWVEILNNGGLPICSTWALSWASTRR